MKKHFTLVMPILFASMMFFMLSCDKTSSPTGGSTTGSVDAGIVGVWFTLSDTTGFDIKSDGTTIPLVVDNTGKIATASMAGVTYKITTNGANITITLSLKGNVTSTGRDTTFSVSATYAISNNNNTMTITVTDNGQVMNIVYFKTSIGANAFTGGGGVGTNTFSFTVVGTTYNGTIVNPMVSNGFFSATSVQTGTSLNIVVPASIGTKNVSPGVASGFLSLSTSSYSATGGSIIVTSYSNSNIKGTINITVTQSSGTATKNVTGNFDINF